MSPLTQTQNTESLAFKGVHSLVGQMTRTGRVRGLVWSPSLYIVNGSTKLDVSQFHFCCHDEISRLKTPQSRERFLSVYNSISRSIIAESRQELEASTVEECFLLAQLGGYTQLALLFCLGILAKGNGGSPTMGWTLLRQLIMKTIPTGQPDLGTLSNEKTISDNSRVCQVDN